ncbi:uncharacterized protein C8R40DRAFT_1170657 [Lentinula edodes]|uniref:uncharacterized protein n=1 Tax=Lentinula edodes TaxID=5353 RepID=UPI001E8E884C|nr:uncharacterized protein C8R40DRAFT_1170657 [Lentinula edodes]KAH7875029.1 hypothetical protein C8R40DRAFT_1170657 [Lentinula edodes]
MSYTIPQPPMSYANGAQMPKGTTSMDSFVDFDFNNGEQRPPNHRKGFSSPLNLFRNRKKSTGDSRENSPAKKLSTVRSADSLNTLDHNSFKVSRSRALPPLPQSEPTSASHIASSPSSFDDSTFILAPLRMSPQPDEWSTNLDTSKAQVASNSSYEGLPNHHDQISSLPLHATHGLPIIYPQQRQPLNTFDAALQENGQSVIDESSMLDRNVAPALFVAEGLKTDTPHPHHKHSIEVMKNIAFGGATHLKEAEEALDQFTASPVWTEGKEIAETLLEPAKDVVQLFDALTPLVPMFIIAKSVFVVIVQKELDQRQNDKNMDFQNQLQQLLTQVSALTINTVNEKTDALNQKLDVVIAAINSLTPAESRVQAKIDDFGGEEKAFQASQIFFYHILINEFGIKVTPQLKSILREDLASQLKSNEAMFKLQLEATQRDLEQSMERNTDAILTKLDAGPHELIRDEDIRQIWKGKYGGHNPCGFTELMPKYHQKWRLSCKTRHFVDALHHYYVQKFTQYRKTTGETHKDQWTLRFTGRVICKWIIPSPGEILVNLTEPTPAVQPAIGDAIDMDASGYVSIDEVNRFTAHCPVNWSIPVFLAHAAAGWYQSALDCRERCLDALQKIDHRAKRMLPPNRKHLRPYFQNGCLPEIWYIVDSLNTDTFKYQQEDMRFQFEKLASYRKEFMQATYTRLQKNLVNVKYRMVGSEDVRAVMGTSRCEAMVLPLLMLLLERHAKIFETADNFILSDREFQDMTTSMQSIVYAFGRRYSILTEGWRQQRFDIPLQMSCFSYGIFVNWHTHFSSIPFEHSDLHLQEYMPRLNDLSQNVAHGPGPVKDLLTYDLPLQPNAEELRRLRSSLKARIVKKEDAKTRERYGNFSQRVKSKRSSRLGGSAPRSPTIKIDTDIQKSLHPSSAASPIRRKHSNSSYEFEFEDTDGVLHAINVNDGNASADSDSELPDIAYTKGKILTLDDRIKSVEAELSSMKTMLAQLLAISKSQSL